ncbi:MAG: hypothetical protein ISP49_09815 [Reyranella sp.]|nr:hypothetical protein [Reyranella sp.]MBL6651877.1 hypothetical protein [Reyranella sp.]
MNGKRPDLAKLTPPEKDALIRDLWRQVAAGQSEARLLRRRLGIAEQASEKGESALLEKLREAAPRRPVEPPAGFAVKLGRGLRLWRSPVVMGTAAILCAAFAIDGGIGIWQQRALLQQRQARLLLEHEARSSLYVELKSIVPEADGKSYRMTLALQNIDLARPLYIMPNTVGVYVQTGMTWQQVPSRPVGEAANGVIKLTDAHSYDVLFTPDVKGWAELIPGYMHVRIQADMLISRSAQPGNDIVERRTPFYVYLKPHGANDADIKARSKMSGTPPVFIPMPPH